MSMSRLDEIKSRIDWLKDLFKIVTAIMVADAAGMAALYMDDKMGLLFCMAGLLLPLFAASCTVISRKIELHLNELAEFVMIVGFVAIAVALLYPIFKAH